MIRLLLALTLCAIGVSAQQASYGKASNGALLPDSSVTPGDVLTTDTAKVCTRGYAGSVRNVSSATKKRAYADYAVKPNRPKAEVDHLISLELGGSNDISNLWPQPYSPAPGAHEKDSVEQYLHWAVCVDQSMTLPAAQKLIRTDWTEALPAARKHFKH